MVMQLLKILILIVVILVAWHFIAPHLAQHEVSPAGGDEGTNGSPDASTCVQAASETNDSVVEALSEISWPKVDQARWNSVRSDLESQVGTAQTTCSCAEPACATASQMLQDIEDLISEADGAINGGLTGMFNPATKEENIQALLTKARAQAAGGF